MMFRVCFRTTTKWGGK